MMSVSKQALTKLLVVFLIGTVVSLAAHGFIILNYFSKPSFGSYTLSGIPTTPKVAFQSVIGNATTSTITIHAQSTGGGAYVLANAIITDSQDYLVAVISATSIDDHNANTAIDAPAIYPEVTKLDFTISTPIMAKMEVGKSYTVTLSLVPSGREFGTFTAVGVTPW